MRMLRSIFLVMLFWPATVSAEGALSPLSINTEKGEVKFLVELVNTPETRARGLMDRPDMPRDHGMLFDFGRERLVSFWMKNTLIPLDMLFADASGRIFHIHSNAQPHDETSIPSNGPARLVLEINGGLAKELGIQPGDRLRHTVIGD